MQKIKVIELFAGVGSQAMALRNIGIDYEVIGISEIDKFAFKSYEAIHGKTFIWKWYLSKFGHNVRTYFQTSSIA